MSGKNMPRNRNEEEEVEIPGNEDENVGDGQLPKKREKKRKSKEERIAERKVIFWTLLVILVITVGFWLMPKIGSIFNGDIFKIDSGKTNGVKSEEKKPENKNYIEITL
jgi:hypothetical protein